MTQEARRSRLILANGGVTTATTTTWKRAIRFIITITGNLSKERRRAAQLGATALETLHC